MVKSIISKNNLGKILALLFLILGVIISFSVYSERTNEKISNHNIKYLSDLGRQKADLADDLLRKETNIIRSSSVLYKRDLCNPETRMGCLRDLEDFADYEDMVYLDMKDFKAYFSKSGVKDYSFIKGKFQNLDLKTGGCLILNKEFSHNNKRYVLFYRGIYMNDKLMGVLIGFHNEQFLSKFVNYELFGYSAKCALYEKDGNLVTASSDEFEENFDSVLDLINCKEYKNLKTHEPTLFKPGEGFTFRHKKDFNNASGYVYVMTEQPWILLMVFPGEAANLIVNDIKNDADIQIVAIVMLFILFTGYLLLIDFWDISILRQENQDANYDTLTHLLNRRSMKEWLERIMTDSLGHRGSFSVFMIDLDNFKKVNDTYGHDAGDMILKAVSDVIVSNTQVGDKVFRWGGEEILVVMTKDEKKCRECAERIRSQVTEIKVPYNDIFISITITLGLYTYDGSMSMDEVIKKADENMYIGKKSGKNRIIG